MTSVKKYPNLSVLLVVLVTSLKMVQFTMASQNIDGKAAMNEQKIWHNLRMSGAVLQRQELQVFQAFSPLLATIV